MSYKVTEGPNAVVSVCATIQLGSVGRDVAVILVTPVTGTVLTGGLLYKIYVNSPTGNKTVCMHSSFYDMPIVII